MKKFLKSLAIVLALAASSAIVLHAAHLDSAHLGNSPAHCGICETTPDTVSSVSVSVAPAFIITNSLSSFTYVSEPAATLLLFNPRGPPALSSVI